MPPEIRIKKITGDGLVSLAFTNIMLFSDDLKTTLNSNINDQSESAFVRDLSEDTSPEIDSTDIDSILASL